MERVYGGIVNMPADDRVLTEALNSNWTSDDGQRFHIRARVFSPQLGQAAVTNSTVVDDLSGEHPLINGSRGHATLVARVDYQQTQNVPRIFRVHVIDPWPGAAPPPYYARFLAPDEMVPVQFGGSLRYLASIRIS